MLRRPNKIDPQFFFKNLRAKLRLRKLARNEAITALVLDGVYLGGQELADAIARNSHLRSLDILNCEIEEADALVRIHRRLNQLTRFVCRNTLDPGEEKKLQQVVKQLNVVDLTKTTAAASATQPLAKASDVTDAKQAAPPLKKSAPLKALLTAPLYLASLLAEPKASPEAKAEGKQVALAQPAEEKLTDVTSAQMLFYTGMKSTERARQVLSNPTYTNKLTGRRISVLLRLISSYSEMKKFLAAFKDKLTLSELTTVAEHQQVAATILLQDPTIPFGTNELAKIGKAHLTLLKHPRIKAAIPQFDLQQLADIYDRIPQIALQEVAALLEKKPTDKKGISALLSVLQAFTHHKAVCEVILNHPTLDEFYLSHSRMVTQLIAVIGIHHPALVLPFLHLLNDRDKAKLAFQPLIADALLMQYEKNPSTLYLIALHHPASKGLSIISNPIFIQHANSGMIIALGHLHPDLATYIIETKALREKVSTDDLILMCQDHHHLVMRLIEQCDIEELPIHAMSWKIAHDLIEHTPETLSKTALMQICQKYPDLANKVFIRNNEFDLAKGQFTFIEKLTLAGVSELIASKLIHEMEKQGADGFIAYESLIAKILVNHPSLISFTWLNILEPDSRLELAAQHLTVAHQFLFDAQYAEILDAFTTPQILQWISFHQDLVLENREALAKHPSQKIRAIFPKILALFVKSDEPKDAKQLATPLVIGGDAKAHPAKVVPPTATTHPIDLLVERLATLLIQHRDEPFAPKAFFPRTVPLDKTVYFDQSDLLKQFPHDLAQQGVCAGIGLYYLAHLHKHARNPYKNFATKFSKPFSLNLVDRIGYFQYFHATHLLSPIFQVEFLQPDANQIIQEIKKIIALLFQHPVICVATHNHLLYLVRRPSDGTIITGDANNGFTAISYSDLVHKLMDDISRTAIGTLKKLTVHVIPHTSLNIPPALIKPSHLKAIKQVEVAELKSTETPSHTTKRNQLHLLHECLRLELTAQTAIKQGKVEEAVPLFGKAIKLRKTFPQEWDLNAKALGENYSVLEILFNLIKKRLRNSGHEDAAIRFKLYLANEGPFTKNTNVSRFCFLKTLTAIGLKEFQALFVFPIDLKQLAHQEEIAALLIKVGLAFEAKEFLCRARASCMQLVIDMGTPHPPEAIPLKIIIARLSMKLGHLTEAKSAKGLREKIGYFKRAFQDAKGSDKTAAATEIAAHYLQAAAIPQSFFWEEKAQLTAAAPHTLPSQTPAVSMPAAKNTL